MIAWGCVTIWIRKAVVDGMLWRNTQFLSSVLRLVPSSASLSPTQLYFPMGSYGRDWPSQLHHGAPLLKNRSQGSHQPYVNSSLCVPSATLNDSY